MSEQLYRIERRSPEVGERASYINSLPTYHILDVLVPVPEVHDLGWACREMIRNPMREYASGPTPKFLNRWNATMERFEFREAQFPQGRWINCDGFCREEIASTSWHAVDAVETPEAFPPLKPPAKAYDDWADWIEKRLDVLEKSSLTAGLIFTPGVTER